MKSLIEPFMSQRRNCSCCVCCLIILAVVMVSLLVIFFLLSSSSELPSTSASSSSPPPEEDVNHNKLDRDMLMSDDRFHAIPSNPMTMMMGPPHGFPSAGGLMGGMMGAGMPPPPGMFPGLMGGPPGGPFMGGPMMGGPMMGGPMMGGPMMMGMPPPPSLLGMGNPMFRPPGFFGSPGGMNGAKCRVNCDHGPCMRQCCSFEPIMRNGDQAEGQG